MIKDRQYFIETSAGGKFEISELDFNNIIGRINKGSTNGWYMQRGDTQKNSRDDWQISFKDIAMVFAEGRMKGDKNIKKPGVIDIEKHKPEPVGKPEQKKLPKCAHDWNRKDDWIHVTTIVGGVNRYYKQCINCNAKSTLIKKREVELAQEAIGETLDTVPFVE